MAVFDHSEDQYRYSCFAKYFGSMESGSPSDDSTRQDMMGWDDYNA